MNDQPRPDAVTLRPPTPADGAAVHRIVVDSGVLDVNSVYAYVLWFDRFAHSSVVVDSPEGLLGFVTGFVDPSAPDTWFCWQVGVAEAGRGQGLATRMLQDCLARSGATWLETTITPSNTASRALFHGLARRHDAGVTHPGAFPGTLLASLVDASDSAGHETEELFRIGPFQRNA